MRIREFDNMSYSLFILDTVTSNENENEQFVVDLFSWCSDNWLLHLPFVVWGGDPVYPTVNYIQEPDKVIDYRGPDFHEPTPNMLAYLKEVSTLQKNPCYLKIK